MMTNPTYKSASTGTATGTCEEQEFSTTNPYWIIKLTKYYLLAPELTPTLTHFIHYAMFNHIDTIILKNGEKLVIKKFGPVRGCETSRFLWLEQNPNKGSSWGQMAKRGHKILWVIRKEGNRWIGRLVNKTLIPMEK